jgi:hypothetical protein
MQRRQAEEGKDTVRGVGEGRKVAQRMLLSFVGETDGESQRLLTGLPSTTSSGARSNGFRATHEHRFELHS